MSSTIPPTSNLALQHKSAGPLILVYSPRARVRDILNVGLTQSGYRVIKADSSHIATIKALQFLPDLFVADVTVDHPKDILLLPRLRKTVRTADLAVLLVLPRRMRDTLIAILKEDDDSNSLEPQTNLATIEYPFSFLDIQRVVQNLVTVRPHAAVDQPTEESVLHNKIAHDLFDAEISIEKKLRSVEQTISKQWAFPFTVIRALDIIESSASCCGELGACISTDAGAASAILRVSNTIPYAKRTRGVSDITEAVSRLGFRETRNLLACLALIDLSPDVAKRYGFSRKEFWLHSLATAVFAEKISSGAGHPRPELAFIAGLVHDLGKVPVDNNFSPVFSLLLEETANQVSSFNETEERLMGFTHADLGHYFLAKWNFPSVISQAILNHHRPDRIMATPTLIDRIIQASVFVANIMAKAMGMGHSCDEFLDEIPAAMLRDLRMPKGLPDRMILDVNKSVAHLCNSLNVAAKSLVSERVADDQDAEEIIAALGRNVSFHPLVPALVNKGFRVRSVNQLTPEVQGNARIVINITEKGSPLDVMLYEDDAAAESASATLRIHLVDTLPEQVPSRNLENGTMVFMNRKHLDFRLLVHTIDRFLDGVAAPDSASDTHSVRLG